MFPPGGKGMVVRTDSERVRLSRRMVLEFLASSVDVSTAPELQSYLERYGGQPSDTGPRRRQPENRKRSGPVSTPRRTD